MSRRQLVLEEIVNTERDYIAGLSLVKKCYIDKLKNEPEFPQDVMAKIFINVEDILAFHIQLFRKFEDSRVLDEFGVCEQIFLDNKDGFLIYTNFCNHHEHSTTVLYELLSSPAACAHIKSCQLLSGSKLNLEAYLLSVIQRICKYPLLLKELKKATESPQNETTQAALDAMLFVANAVNEDKRRMENLQKIDNWQSMVTGWTGPKLRDTSRQLLCHGLLTKWSRTAGKKVHSNQRWFFLFDNVLVYCKGTPASAKRGKTDEHSILENGEGLTFKGRIDTRNIALLDMEDDKGHAETNGQAVRFAFKISNQAKGKWYILACGSQEEKDTWMESLLEEQRRYLRSQAGRMARIQPSDKAALKLRELLGVAGAGKGKQIIRDFKSGLRTHRTAFAGEDLVAWLVHNAWAGVTDYESAVIYGQSLVDDGVIHHVNDKFGFENSSKLYRFRTDDGTYSDKRIIQDLQVLGVRIYLRLNCTESFTVIRPVVYHMKTYHNCFEGCELIDWLIDQQYVNNRDDGKTLGTALLQAGFIHHVTDEHVFADKPHFYRFTADDVLGRPTTVSRIVPNKTIAHAPKQHVITKKNGTYGFVLTSAKPAWIRSVDEGSPAEHAGLCPGDYVFMVNDTNVTQLDHLEVVHLIRESGETVSLFTRPRAVHERMMREQRRGSDARRASHGCLSFSQTEFTYPSTIGKNIKVTETLDESQICLAAARACLQLFIEEDQEMATIMGDVNFLSSLGCRTDMGAGEDFDDKAILLDDDDADDDEIDDQSLDTFEDEITDEARDTTLHQISSRILTYEHILSHIGKMDAKSLTFKSSLHKNDDLLAFVPANLHHQRMDVLGDAEQPTVYHYTTVGVFSAHNLGLDAAYLGWENLRLRPRRSNTALLECQRQYNIIQDRFDRMQALEQRTIPGQALDDVQLANFYDNATKIRDAAAIFLRKAHKLCASADRLRAVAVSALALHITLVTKESGEAIGQRAQDVCYLAKQCFIEVQAKVAMVDNFALCEVVPVPDHPPMHGLTYRLDLLNAQAISAVVSCLLTQLSAVLTRTLAAKATSDVWLDTICQHGVLLCFQSLVSTGDKELSMLADHDQAVSALNRVTVSFRRATADPGSVPFLLSGSRLAPHITLFVDKHIFTLLSREVQDGRWLPIVAVLFTQGVNEVQTMCNQLQGTDFQDFINEKNFKLLSTYCARVRVGLLQRLPQLDGEADALQRAEVTKREEILGNLENALEAELNLAAEKNLSLLTAAQELCAALHGLTVVSCKSAKDRTAMLVTLYQTCELVRHHNLNFSMFRQMLKQMRTFGVRRDNVIKNTGKDLYAFSEAQVAHLPSLLQPPEGTYGKNIA
eukprot:m.195448 g.195448  ORF g.195448 m.195448 type:complete len:1343 (-) comp16802_c16_seq2:279-4307(-)